MSYDRRTAVSSTLAYFWEQLRALGLSTIAAIDEDGVGFLAKNDLDRADSLSKAMLNKAEQLREDASKLSSAAVALKPGKNETRESLHNAIQKARQKLR